MTKTLFQLSLSRLCIGASFLLLLLASCAKEKKAGVETTNGFTVSVQLSDGSPAREARYYLVSQSDWQNRIAQQQSPVLDSGITDKNGLVYLDTLRNGSGLEVYAALQSGRIVLHDSMTTEPSLALAPSAQFSGSYVGSAQYVYLAGTSLSAPVLPDGSFSFSSVPAGTYGVVVQSESTLNLDYVADFTAGVGKTVNSETPSSSLLVLEDFNDGDRKHRFASATGNPVWFWSSDSVSSLLELPQNADGDFRQALTDSTAQAGLSLHIHALVEEGVANRYANIGLNFFGDAFPGGPWVNICGMDSLSFSVKGTGSVILQFATPLFEENPGRPTMYGAIITLTEAWQKISLLPEQILPMDGRVTVNGAPTWSEQCAQVRNLTFTFDGPAEFWLDDISFAGEAVVQQFEALAMP